MEVLTKKSSQAYLLCQKYSDKHLSEVTGFVHYFSDKKVHESTDLHTHTIPSLQNILYALSLFRSKQCERIFEAKDLLDRVFFFQRSDGSFPRYFHDIARADQYDNQFLILFALIWVQRDYGRVLEADFLNKLNLSLDKLFEYLQNQESYFDQYRLTLLELFDQVRKSVSIAPIAYTGSINEEVLLFIFLQKFAPTQVAFYYNRLKVFYHPIFCNLSTKSGQKKSYRKPSLFDFVFAEITSHYTEEFQESSSLHFFGSLIDFSAFEHDIDFSISDAPIILSQPEIVDKFDHHFRLLWRDGSLQSLVCQDKALSLKLFNRQNEYVWIFTYPEEYERRREGDYELNLFTEFSEKKDISINNQKATVFNLGDQVTINSGEKRLALSFEVIEGEGQFCGHIMRGNRCSQVEQDLFAAYDYRIAFRTIERSQNLQVKITASWL